MSGAPLPSKLVLISDLVNCKAREKVRFLGCIDEYRIPTATLILKHRYPTSAPPSIVHVNVEHVLESIKRCEVDVGSWINVIGYVEKRAEKRVFVQALVVWDAGNVDLDAYERGVDQRREVEKQGI
ncbi:hypothetical protein K469DRAFT_630998 [Zopfia rhizophila CBS 207.26]|uniref:CST complex subunit Ten1 n=1 Tax=Zopfia rhizophila CBS 207.26 TaxID=1314779 RepID=A0A6A6E8S1_9PEZI|nr:hypothetical protein K469DRAFT_630998 [Zopfia rhizophila CBS 207.26]